MNASAQKKARQAELEFELLTAWNERGLVGFGEWLHDIAASTNWHHTKAKELISLYEEGTL